MGKLDGKVAIITGGGRGIGRAIADGYAREGARVVVTAARERLDQLNEIYADPLKLMRSGWVDYVAPQLYWKDNSPQSFTELLKWWRDPRVNPRHIPVYPGIAAYRMSEQGWPARGHGRDYRRGQAGQGAAMIGAGGSGHGPG